MDFRVLGPLQVWTGGREIAIPASRHRVLLAALLLRANRVVATDELIRTLWGEELPGNARATVQTYVRRLRHALGGTVIRTRPPGYVIEASTEQLDLARFDHLLARARHTSDPRSEAELLSQALALWRGPALSDVDSDLLHHEDVAALTERRLGAWERRIELDLSAGQPAELVAELRTLTREHPLRERFWELLMRALVGCGRQAEALQAYEELRGRLADELGIDPSEQLRRLHRAILRCEITVPASTAVRQPVSPAQLPPNVSAFTGRAGVLRRLDTILDEGWPNVLVIAAIDGVAGVGKTTLAVRWAHRVRDRFPDGQLYADLRGHDPTPPLQPIHALARFLTALGVPADQVPTELDEATAMYRTMLAGRRALVVLDNAASAGQVRPLLPGEGGCLVLVTSRNRLGGLVARDGAHLLSLDVLNRDEATALLGTLLGPDRMAGDVGAAAELAELAELCGRLPLALRIAAANLLCQPRLSLAAYNEQLRSSGRVRGLSIEGDEQSAISVAFGLSYQRLPGPARRMFRLLGLSPGTDIDVAAAAALADLSHREAEALLRLLVNAHLAEQTATGRYRLHDLLRDYAADRVRDELAVPDRDQAKRRLYDYYLHTADAAARHLYPDMLRLLNLPAVTAPEGAPTTAAEALTWFDAERSNLVAVVSETAVHGPRVVACQLADTLRGYFNLRVHTVDSRAVSTAALAAAEANQDLAAQVSAHLSLYGLYASQCHYRFAIQHAARALRLSQRAGLGDAQAALRLNLGYHYVKAGHAQQAARHLTEALAWYELTGQRSGRASALVDLSMAFILMGRIDDAADHVRRGLTIRGGTGSRLVTALGFTAQAQVQHARGRPVEARKLLLQALAEYRQIGLEVGIGDTLSALARLELDRGERAPATRLAQQALEIARRTGHRRFESYALNTMGRVQRQRGLLSESLDCHQRALRLAEDTGSPLPQCEALVGLASVHVSQGRCVQARALLRQALAISRDAGLSRIEEQAHAVLAATPRTGETSSIALPNPAAM